MSAERMQQLQAMLAEEPGDTFLRYAIALEHKRMGNMEQAIADLSSILTDEPKHVPSYYQLASLQAELGLVAEAVHTCEAGALQCIVTNDLKARMELLALKRALLDEE
jgi:predicted Zn-dependent protease